MRLTKAIILMGCIERKKIIEARQQREKVMNELLFSDCKLQVKSDTRAHLSFSTCFSIIFCLSICTSLHEVEDTPGHGFN